MRAVRGLRGEHPLELLLRVSGMSRSTYYHRAGSLRRREDGRREDALIAEVFSGSGGEYGCREGGASRSRGITIRRYANISAEWQNLRKQYRNSRALLEGLAHVF